MELCYVVKIGTEGGKENTLVRKEDLIFVSFLMVMILTDSV